ncbi:MMPL family transporter, partial [Phaeovulum sp.]|uniref:MMPL family transporter n=1 Tax=Phaeovulum sp. TaxID=2934796 RepID=UPI003563153A
MRRLNLPPISFYLPSGKVVRQDAATVGQNEVSRMRLFDLARLLTGWQAHRRLALVILALITLVAAVGTQRLHAEVDISTLLRGKSPIYAEWAEVERRFAPFSNDEVYVVGADNGTLADATRLTSLEDLLIDLNLTPGVAATLSIHSIPSKSEPGRPWLKSEEAKALEPTARLTALRGENTTAAQILSPDLGATLVVVMPEAGQDNAALAEAIAPMIAAPPPGLTIRPAGLNEMQRTISYGLLRDQLVLTPASIIVCLAITFWLFGSWRATVICGVPPLMGLLWFFGALGWSGMAIDQFMAVVPTVLIVLSFSDCVHLYHASVSTETEPDDPLAALRAQAQTLPAAFMTSLTTAIAFLSLLVVQAPALSHLSL